MSIKTFDYIFKHFEEAITPFQTNLCKIIRAEERLMITLRFLSTGASFRSLSFSFKMGKSTVASIVHETCTAIYNALQPDHMPFPTVDLLENVSKEFELKWNFPNCVGCVDGKHIRIKHPTNSGSMFYNYKHFHSIVLQAVADAKCRFLAIDVGAYGKQSDGGVFTFQRQITRLSRARRYVECAFGIMSAKWRILFKAIETSVPNAKSIVKCVAILHNVVIDLEGAYDGVMNDSTAVLPTSFRRNKANSAPGKIAKCIRDTFRDYFNAEGAVPWQNNM
ncbi:uncharacterized protein LOC142486104 [Ascaphus truei]|uniref:uncharacterized protein LOC142486104 n=1 Tax=Ascaphus truei TaxID=8439 RepID=UPI003F599978